MSNNSRFLVLKRLSTSDKITSIMDNSNSAHSTQDVPDLSEVCMVGKDMTDYCVKKLGSGVRKLDLSYNMIQRVKGLEISAETLEELILDNNKLERLELIGSFPRLHTLSLNKNMIHSLIPLIRMLKRCCPKLRHLSLLGNPSVPDQLTLECTNELDYELYRYYILHHLPTLRFLDFRAVTHQELFKSRASEHKHIQFYQELSPLPPTKASSSKKSPPKGKSRQGWRKFKYVGKNSEGNRFIRDTDL